MWSFPSPSSRVIMHPPVCWLGEFCCHYGVCAEKAIKGFVQMYSRRRSKNCLKGLARWELNGDAVGCLAVSDQPEHLYNSQQEVWEHIISPGKELAKRIILLIQSFSVSEAQDKVRKTWLRQQVYYLSSSSQSNQGMASSIGQPFSFINFSQFEAAASTLQASCQPVVSISFFSSCMSYQAGERWFSSSFGSRTKDFGTAQESTCGEAEKKVRKRNACYAQEKLIN